MEVQVDELGHQRLCLGFYVEAILSGRRARNSGNLSTAQRANMGNCVLQELKVAEAQFLR